MVMLGWLVNAVTKDQNQLAVSAESFHHPWKMVPLVWVAKCHQMQSGPQLENRCSIPEANSVELQPVNVVSGGGPWQNAGLHTLSHHAWGERRHV